MSEATPRVSDTECVRTQEEGAVCGLWKRLDVGGGALGNKWDLIWRGKGKMARRDKALNWCVTERWTFKLLRTA